MNQLLWRWSLCRQDSLRLGCYIEPVEQWISARSGRVVVLIVQIFVLRCLVSAEYVVLHGLLVMLFG